jgi:hypothetical protein
VTKIGEYKVDLLREYWSILKKALTRVSGAYGELFDEKNLRLKISCQGPFKHVALLLSTYGPKYKQPTGYFVAQPITINNIVCLRYYFVCVVIGINI